MEEQAKELRILMGKDSNEVKTKNHKTRIIAITSGKGGVGKTNVAVNMAIAYAQIGKKVILIDASKLGEEYKDANGLKKVRLSNDEIERIVTTFLNKEAVDDFSVAVTYDEIKEKGYSLSAGQYFDIKIDYVDITEEEFNQRMTGYKQTLTQQFEESHRLEAEIMKQLDSLRFND